MKNGNHYDTQVILSTGKPFKILYIPVIIGYKSVILDDEVYSPPDEYLFSLQSISGGD